MEMEHILSFPRLGISFGTIRRVAFSVFGKPIMWYGVIIAAGFLLASLYAMRRTKDFSVKDDDFLDALICATPSAIICARLYYVAFNFSYYREHPEKIIRIWDGGIAIYGAVIGAIAAVLIFCRIRRLSPLPLLDLAALGLLIGQCIGRWGNFVNAEAFGRVTTLPWGMSINGASPVHPTFLYESLWNLLGFILLHRYSKKRRYNGQIFLMYISWYGFGRCMIEGLRTDSLYLPGTGIRVSQLLAGLSFIAAAALLLFFNFRAARSQKEELTSEPGRMPEHNPQDSGQSLPEISSPEAPPACSPENEEAPCSSQHPDERT